MTAAAAGDKSDLTFRGGLFTGDERRIQMYVYQVVVGQLHAFKLLAQYVVGVIDEFFHGGSDGWEV